MLNRLMASTALMLIATQIAHGEAPPSDATQLEEIVVTAEHHKADVQKTAIAITALSGADLAEEAKTSVAATLKDVPSLLIQTSPQGGQIFIRGVGANGDSNWIDPDIAINLDGVYSGRAESVFASAYDLDRVEVLRGPQGTLYGRNATGGVVNILTNDPGDAYGAGVNVALGNYNLQHVDGYVNLPLTDDFAVRVAGMRETRDGYYSNDGGGANNAGARAKLLWRPTDTVTIKAGVDWLRMMGEGETTVPSATSFVGAVNPANPWDVTPLHLGPATFPLLADRINYKFTTAFVQLDWDLDWAVLTLMPSYSYSDRYVLTQLFAPGPQGIGLWNQNQYTGEARLASSAGSPITWVGGVYVLSSQEIGGQASGNTVYAVLPATLGASSDAAFAQATYPITDRLRATVGMRYTIDSKSDKSPICTSNDGVTCNGLDFNDSEYTNSSSAFTYKVGLDYDLAPDSMLYGQVASGYKAGGYSTTSYPAVAYKPEDLTAFELGSKNRFLDNKLQVNVELYYYDYSQYQVQYSTYIPYTATFPAKFLPPSALSGEEFQQFVGNAASGTNLGGEIEAKYQITGQDRLDLSVAYTQASYGALVIPNAPGPPGTGGPNPVAVTGRAVANTPKWNGVIAYQHDWTVLDGDLRFRVSTKLSSGYYATIQEWYPAPYQGGYSSTDMYLNYTAGSGKWSVGLWAKNLENGAQKTTIFPFYRAELSNPQTFGTTLSYYY